MHLVRNKKWSIKHYYGWYCSKSIRSHSEILSVENVIMIFHNGFDLLNKHFIKYFIYMRHIIIVRSNQFYCPLAHSFKVYCWDFQMMMIICVLRPLLCTTVMNLQIYPRRDSNTGGSDLWSNTLSLYHRRPAPCWDFQALAHYIIVLNDTMNTQIILHVENCIVYTERSY